MRYSVEDEGIDLEIHEWIEALGGQDIPSPQVKRALEFVKEKHKHQLRKDCKTEYWHHLEQVVNNSRFLGIKDEATICAGWLHDTIEDTNTDYDDLKEQFGAEVARTVAAVTKDKRLVEEDRENAYVAQLRAASWKAQVVKLCDIWANMADLPSGYSERTRQIEQAEKKLRYFDAIREGLSQNRDKIPNLVQGIRALNDLLTPYDKAIKL
jgi:(p)ppGpp synthase/HD superfamily hydrolase